MHVVVIGCGRVGSELAGALELADHTVAVIDKNGRAFRRLPADFSGRTVVGLRVRPRPPRRSRHRRGRRLRVGDERRQLQHPVRPHRTRDVRDRARRRPHLRPAPRAHLPTARHPDGRDRRRGRPTRCCGGCCPTRPATTGSTPTGKVGLVERPIPPAAVGHKLGAAQQARAASGSPRCRGSVRRRSSRATWSARKATCSCSSAAMDALDELQAHIDAGGEH